MMSRSLIKGVKYICPLAFSFLVFFATIEARALTVDYTLDNIFLNNGNQMTGAFTWDYNAGDFENGTGTFTELSIPGTLREISELNITFDIANSIEFTLAANLNNRGIDVTLFLSQPLTPTQSAPIDLTRSTFEVTDPGLLTGDFVSGSVSLLVTPVPLPSAFPLFGAGLAALGFVGWQRKRRLQKAG